MVMYQSPSFGGFSFGVGYSFNADAKASTGGGFRTNENNRVLTTGLKFSNGPLTLVATYDNLNPSAAKGDVDNVQAYVVGGAYDFEVVEVHAAWGQTFDGWFSSLSMGTDPDFSGYDDLSGLTYVDGSRVDSAMVGLTVPLGSTKVFGGWQRAEPNNAKLTGGEETMNIFALGATYDLSKRTNLYAYAAYADNFAFHEDVRNTAVGVGIRHRF